MALDSDDISPDTALETDVAYVAISGPSYLALVFGPDAEAWHLLRGAKVPVDSSVTWGRSTRIPLNNTSRKADPKK